MHQFLHRFCRSALLAGAIALTSGVGACSSAPSNTSPEYEENFINHEVSQADIEAAKSPEPIAADRVVLWVNGLGCPLCASNIDRQLERVRGVESVKVDLSVGKVTLGLSSKGSHPSPARLGEAVEDAGFTLVKVER